MDVLKQLSRFYARGSVKSSNVFISSPQIKVICSNLGFSNSE